MSNIANQAFILNSFNTTYRLTEFLESITNRGKRIYIRYIKLINRNKLINALLKVNKNVLKGIVVDLTADLREKVIKKLTKALIKQKEENLYHYYIISEGFLYTLLDSAQEYVQKQCTSKTYKDLDHLGFLCPKHTYYQNYGQQEEKECPYKSSVTVNKQGLQ